jgi:ribokinase
MKENFKKLNMKNVDSNIFLMENVNTTIAQVMVEETGNNRIVLTTGANDHLNQTHFDENWENIRKCSIFLCQLEVNMELVGYCLKKAKEEGIFTILNPAPARKDLTDDFFKFSDLIAPNETEAEILTGIEIKTVEDAIASAKILQKKGVSQVIITLGSNGSLYLDKNGEAHHIPSCKVSKVVDTTGAGLFFFKFLFFGDCFLGTLTYFLSCKVDMLTGIQYATFLSSLAIQKKGAQQKYPTRMELLQ